MQIHINASSKDGRNMLNNIQKSPYTTDIQQNAQVMKHSVGNFL